MSYQDDLNKLERRQKELVTSCYNKSFEYVQLVKEKLAAIKGEIKYFKKLQKEEL